MTNRTTWLYIGTAMALVSASLPAAAQQATAGDQQESDQAVVQTSPDQNRSDDIIVTAQKRAQTLLEVPQSVSVVSGELLEQQQAKSFVDYAKLIPGLNITQDTPGQTRLVLRGINTGSPGSTVAVYVDDAPFGASGSLSNGAALAGDFDTFDLERIEVLRGPQGTLYGSNSLGGVLKYVTVAPKLDKIEGRGQAGVEDVAHGATGYLGNLVLNLPLGHVAAVRASGFYHKTAGYVDALGINKADVNGSESYGGRASLLVQPASNFSIRLSALAQNIRAKSSSSFTANPISLRPVNPTTGIATGKDNRVQFERYPEFHHIDYRLYSGTVDWDLGFGDLTSATSYSTQKQDQISDITTGIQGADGARGLANLIYSGATTLPGALAAFGNPTRLGLAYQNNASVNKFTQEARFASRKSDVFDFIVGGYYTHEKTDLFQRYVPFTLADNAFINRATTIPAFLAPVLGPAAGTTIQEFVTAAINAKYEEIAGFGSGTLHLGTRFDLTAGGRYSHNRQSSSQVVNQLGTGVPVLGKSSEGVFTWNVSPRFELSDRTAVYARVAKGYRPGGPNFVPPGGAGVVPAQFNSDTLVSYEAGIKAQTEDRKFSLDLTGFYVNWDNILILSSVTVPGVATPVGVNANGRRARSYGAEATATMRPTDGLTFVANFAYNRAYLRDDSTTAPGAPNITGGLAGDDLPYTPRYAANLSGNYDWALTDKIAAFVGGDVQLRGDQFAGFNSGSPAAASYRTVFGRRIQLDGYATVDLRAGVNVGAFTIQAYVRNLTDSYGLLSAGGYPYRVDPTPAIGGGTGPMLLTASTIQPRTIGGTVGFKF